jgi:citrate lyase subunit beta / citryl-CoA lyase
MLEKALTLDADEIIVDLEDAVPRAQKNNETRRQVVDAVLRLRDAAPSRTIAIRINARETEWREDDLRAVAEARPHTVVLPKVESTDELREVAAALPAATGLEVQIETARGLVEVERIAAARPETLVFGPGDFAASVGVPVLTIGAGPTDYALSRIVVAAHAYGVQAIDGPYVSLGDDDGLAASAQRAFAHGYDGKWVVHPRQIAAVNDVFTPAPDEVDRALELLASDGAQLLGDEMVDDASRRLAESLLARAHLDLPPSGGER